MSSIFARTGFNFDTTKFGAANEWSDGVKSFMGSSPPPLEPWQLNDMANADVDGYYVNPMTPLVDSLTITVSGIYEIVNVTSFSVNVSSIFATANTCLTELPLFQTHTDYLSGVNTENLDPRNQPDLRLGMAVGRQVLAVTSSYDNIQNNSPIYGSFTSLFVKDDMTTSNTALAQDLIVLQSTISTSGSGTEESPYVYTSNLTAAQANTLSQDLNFLYGSLVRRQADIAYYQNSYTLIKEYQQLEEFNGMGNSQKFLVNNLIGSDKLKTRLA